MRVKGAGLIRRILKESAHEAVLAALMVAAGLVEVEVLVEEAGVRKPMVSDPRKR